MSRGTTVVHFEVIGRDPERLRQYFGDLFGWEFETPSPIAAEVSASASYGFVNLVTSEDRSGIRGGIGVDRVMRATLSSTWESRTSGLHCSEPNASDAHG